jgi:hypothetical protein
MTQNEDKLHEGKVHGCKPREGIDQRQPLSNR